MRPRTLVAFASVCLFVVVPSTSYAWGEKGHRIVALVAAAHLTPAATTGVAGLLALDTDPRVHTLDDAAVWPDLIKNGRPDTKPWHFIDIQVADAHYNQTRDCPGVTHEDCIVTRIAQFRTVLKSPAATPLARLEALKFLTHFLGDLHQPLHCADKHDRGGNDVQVKWFGKKMNLHSVWDGAIVDRAGLTPDVFSEDLLNDVNPAAVASLQAGTVVEWAEASHALAKSNAYKIAPNHRLGQAYDDKNADLVGGQLTKAGLRLARILNESF